MTIKIVVIVVLLAALFIFICLYAHETGYRKRALEDKKVLEDALVAQFRAEHAAAVHRHNAMECLRALRELTFSTGKKAKG